MNYIFIKVWTLNSVVDIFGFIFSLDFKDWGAMWLNHLLLTQNTKTKKNKLHSIWKLDKFVIKITPVTVALLFFKMKDLEYNKIVASKIFSTVLVFFAHHQCHNTRWHQDNSWEGVQKLWWMSWWPWLPWSLTPTALQISFFLPSL